MVCGLQELAKHHAADDEMLNIKKTLLDWICREDYLDTDPDCHGVLKSAYGRQVAFSSWGDYFLMEALARELFQFEPWW